MMVPAPCLETAKVGWNGAAWWLRQVHYRSRRTIQKYSAHTSEPHCYHGPHLLLAPVLARSIQEAGSLPIFRYHDLDRYVGWTSA